MGVHGGRLIAVDPLGTVKWTLARRARCTTPRGAPGLGFAVAYLEGDALRVVAGPATPRPTGGSARGAAPVTPAWRPRSDRVLAYATARAGRSRRSTSTPGGRSGGPRSPAALELAWSRDGRRLVALASRSVTALDAGRSRAPDRRRCRAPRASWRCTRRAGERPWRWSVRRRARARRPARRGRAGRAQLFQGDVAGMAWSQDGRRLLLGVARRRPVARCSARAAASARAARREPRARRGGRVPARGRLVLRRLGG